MRLIADLTSEEKINKFEDIIEIIQSETENGKKLKKENFSELWDNIKLTNIHVIGAPEGKQRNRQKK